MAPITPPALDVSTALAYEENVGQLDPGARFRVQLRDATLFLADDALWLTVLAPPTPVTPGSSRPVNGTAPVPNRPPQRPKGGKPVELQGVNLELTFPGSNPQPRLVPFDPIPASVSYLIGADPAGWHRNVPVWAGVRYQDLYPGVDLELSSQNGSFRWRLIDRTGSGAAALASVHLEVAGAQAVTSAGAELLVKTAVGGLRLPLPSGLAAASATALTPVQPASPPSVAQASADGSSAFDVSPLFAGPGAAPLPAPASNVVTATDLSYSTYLGGNSLDAASSVFVDASDNIYVAGYTSSTTFPTSTQNLGFQTRLKGFQNAFVSRLKPGGAGSADLLASTYLGGNGTIGDAATALAVDAAGNVYVGGYTDSANFPTTSTSFQPTFLACPGSQVGFVAELNAGLNTLTYGSFYGGTNPAEPLCLPTTLNALALDSLGNVYLAGETSDPSLPASANGAQPICPVGASGYCDTAFVAKLAFGGQGAGDLKYATFLGGSTIQGYYGATANAVAVDSQGRVYLAGETSEPDFPFTSGAYQTTCPGTSLTECDAAFLARVNPAFSGASDLQYSTFLGGSTVPVQIGYFGGFVLNSAHALALDSSNNVYLAGETMTLDFPTTSGAFQTSCVGASTFNGCDSGFVTKLAPNGGGAADLLSSTYLGGTIDPNGFGTIDFYGGTEALGLARDASGNVYVTGETLAADFPTTPGSFAPTCAASASSPCDSAFLARLNANLSSLAYGVFVGGKAVSSANFGFTASTYGTAVAVDPAVPGDAWVVGQTNATDLPVTAGAFQTGTARTNSAAAFATRLVTTLSGNPVITETPTPGPSCAPQTSFRNFSFENGLTCWNILSSVPAPQTSTNEAQAGSFSLELGQPFTTTKQLEPTGISAVYQEVKVPSSGGSISLWYWPFSIDSYPSDQQTAYIANTQGVPLAIIFSDCRNDQTWLNAGIDVSQWANQTIELVLLVNEDGFRDPTGMYVDNITLGPPFTPTLTPTITPTVPTSTATATPTTSSTPTITPTVLTSTPSATPSVSASPTQTASPTSSATATETASATASPTSTDTSTETATPSPTWTPEMATSSPTPSPSATETLTAVPSATDTATSSPSPFSTGTGTVTATASATPNASVSPTLSATTTSTSTETSSPTTLPTASPTTTSAAIATSTSTGTSTPTVASALTSTATATSSATAPSTGTASNTPTPTGTVTPTPTGTSSTTGTPTASSTSTSTSTSLPTGTASPMATVTATGTETSTPAATASQTALPTRSPTSPPTGTASPTGTVGAAGTSTPTSTTTLTASSTSTSAPTGTSTDTPSPTPTLPATASPTTAPSATATVTETLTPSPTLTATLTATVAPVVTEIQLPPGSTAVPTVVSNNGQVSLAIPPNFLGQADQPQTVSVSIVPTVLPNSATQVNGATPLLVLDVTLADNGQDTSGIPFVEPLIITVSYDPAQVLAAGLDENSLQIYLVDAQGNATALPSQVDRIAHTVTAPIPHLTDVALAGLSTGSTATPSETATSSPTETATLTSTATETVTSTASATATTTPTSTATETATIVSSASATASATATIGCVGVAGSATSTGTPSNETLPMPPTLTPTPTATSERGPIACTATATVLAGFGGKVYLPLVTDNANLSGW